MAKRGFEKYQDVPAYVSAIIRRGTQLFHEGGSWRSIRLMGVRANAGTAVLELRDFKEEQIWSIVTAFSGTKAHGAHVGTVR